MDRHQFLRLAAATAATTTLALVAGRPAAQPRTGSPRMLTRPLPSGTGALPVIGLGTWQGFDVARGTPEYARLAGVLKALFAAGGSVIDSSPMYGRSEAVAGELMAAAGSRGKAFVATKVWTRGRAEGIRQMEESMRLLRADPIDLMQVHNLLDWRTHLATLREWKAAGRVRRIGVTHYTAGAYADLEAVMRAEALDFVQVNYSPDEPEAAQRILPLAAERGMAVLVNRPFGGGGLLRRLRDRPLPPWAAEIGAANWAQLILKWVLSHPAVTCAIPGTSRPEHMADNAAAGFAAPPDAGFWRTHPLPV
jgi:diketogulonate reductase-like aldo/keto reductase